MPKVYVRLLIVVVVVCLQTSLLKCQNVQQRLRATTEIFEDMRTLKNGAVDKTYNFNNVINEAQPNCIQMDCKFICFNGKSSGLANDIGKMSMNNLAQCSAIEELRLYNYEFPERIIPRGFLGIYADKVRSLYIASSDVTSVAGGAFANGIFRKLIFENLNFEIMEKNFFEGMSSTFEGLVIVQRQQALPSVCSDFLDHVKYQIKFLALEVGITCVRNLTASNSLLNSLSFVDFSYNNFGDQLTDSTFSRLSMVEHLDLSHSNISYLPDYIFSDITDTLEYLDLSFNHLTTLSSTIFGWHEVSRSLKIMANGNDWHCTCALHKEMRSIFIYQSTKKMFCSSPEQYLNWSVFDMRLCDEDITGMESTPAYVVSTGGSMGGGGAAPTMATHGSPYTPPFMTTQLSTPAIASTTTMATTTYRPGYMPLPLDPQDSITMQLECCASSETNLEKTSQLIRRATLEYDILMQSGTVDVIVRSENISDSYGLVWFSRVTKSYYKMQVNYNEYGLGCYGSISYVTTVENLLPGESYTFCVVLRDHLTMSPFNCKSIHMSSNFQVSYSAWLTQDMRAAGISLVVFGIILLTFLGIMLVFLLLKHRPTLLKGSKRVGTTKSNPCEIVVFPKDKTLEHFKLKEQMLAKRSSRSTISCVARRDSTGSNDSSTSYMNANLYEVIPAYLQFDGAHAAHGDLPPLQHAPSMSSYLPTLTTTASNANLVSYAEIPYRTKRTSDDPLPEVPLDQAPLSLPLSECGEKCPQKEYVTYATTLDSRM